MAIVGGGNQNNHPKKGQIETALKASGLWKEGMTWNEARSLQSDYRDYAMCRIRVKNWEELHPEFKDAYEKVRCL